MQPRLITALAVLLLAVVAVAGCTSSLNPLAPQTKGSARDFAQNYVDLLKQFGTRNGYVKSYKIVDNGTDAVMLTLTEENTSDSIYPLTTFGLNVKRFSSVSDATAFYDKVSFGYTPDTPITGDLYNKTTGQSPTVNENSRKIENFMTADFATQQGEYVMWGSATSGSS